jgi:hypothetical protein
MDDVVTAVDRLAVGETWAEKVVEPPLLPKFRAVEDNVAWSQPPSSPV